ncbi:MAG: hypothetical protein CMM08_13435 [Rhodospirillaceae bacterium]|nr:hypothetical protein [Rhodospirillaceae bacterium]
MQEYVREYSFWGFFKGSFGIYFGNFLPLFQIFLSVELALACLEIYVVLADEPDISGPLVGASLAGWNTMAAATVIAVSDVCLGVTPNIQRSYRKLMPIIFPMAATGLLMVLGLVLAVFLVRLIPMLGPIILVIVSVVASIYWMFALTVVVHEHTGARKALKRSFSLFKGFFWRNFGVAITMLFITAANGALFTSIFEFLLSTAGASESSMIWISVIVTNISVALATPPAVIVIVLLYYDGRTRKENFNQTVLAQELTQLST